MPSSRVVEAMPTWRRSRLRISRSSGSISAWTYKVATVICPNVTQPLTYPQPPSSSTITNGVSYARPMNPKRMLRRAIV